MKYRVFYALRSAALSVCLFVATLFGANVYGQSPTIYVDINNGDLNPPNLGQNGWGPNAWRFLQDALNAAEGIDLPPFYVPAVMRVG